jgi:hypothetical protein
VFFFIANTVDDFGFDVIATGNFQVQVLSSGFSAKEEQENKKEWLFQSHRALLQNNEKNLFLLRLIKSKKNLFEN